MAAGKGSRLGNLTLNKPKSLLKLDENNTLLDYNIYVLKKLGITDIIIVTGFNSFQIENHLEGQGVKFIYNPFWNHCNVLGSLYLALPYLNDNFIFLHADTLADYSMWINLLQNKKDNILPFKRKKCGEEEMKIKLNISGNLLFINKTMNSEEATGEFLGIAKFSQNFIDKFKYYAEEIFKNGNLNVYMEEALQRAIEDGEKIDVMDIGESNFIEVDFITDYKNAISLFSGFKINS